ncbi:unnamed protein product [Pleuronectes platessa]|uniref:Uncharacterized protein n=1 Tax=Pleuronectes platessa TaxID=8262 RepID=A0A9N7TPL8_PLEPL|nr:unnamed protein product [Pleuronectes platessa]
MGCKSFVVYDCESECTGSRAAAVSQPEHRLDTLKGGLIPYRLVYLKAVFDINASRGAFHFKCVRTSCRCHCRRGFELDQPWLLGVQRNHPAPFVRDVFSGQQLLRTGINETGGARRERARER